MDTPKLLLDEHIWSHLAVVLRERGFDVIHLCEIGFGGKSDDEVLALASEHQRAVVTYNGKDFIPLARKYFEESIEHAGIILSDQVSRGELQKRVEKLLRSLSGAELKNTVRFLQEFK